MEAAVRGRCEALRAALLSSLHTGSTADWLAQVLAAIQGRAVAPSRTLVAAGRTLAGREALVEGSQAVSSRSPQLALYAALGLPAVWRHVTGGVYTIEVQLDAFESVLGDCSGELLAAACMAALALTDTEHAHSALEFIEQRVALSTAPPSIAVDGIRCLVAASHSAATALLDGARHNLRTGNWSLFKVDLLLWSEPPDGCSPWVGTAGASEAERILAAALAESNTCAQILLDMARLTSEPETCGTVAALIRLALLLLKETPSLRNFATALMTSLFKNQPSDRALILDTLLSLRATETCAALMVGIDGTLRSFAENASAALSMYAPQLQVYLENAIVSATDLDQFVAMASTPVYCLSACALQEEQQSLLSMLVSDTVRRIASRAKAVKLVGLLTAQQLLSCAEPESMSGAEALHSAVHAAMRQDVISLCNSSCLSDGRSGDWDTARWIVSSLELSLLVLSNSWQSQALATDHWRESIGPLVACMLSTRDKSWRRSTCCSSQGGRPSEGCGSLACLVRPSWSCTKAGCKLQQMTRATGDSMGVGFGAFVVQSSQAVLWQLCSPRESELRLKRLGAWSVQLERPLPTVLHHWATNSVESATSIARLLLQLLTTCRLNQSGSEPHASTFPRCTCIEGRSRKKRKKANVHHYGDAACSACGACKLWICMVAGRLAGVEACVEFLPQPGQDVSDRLRRVHRHAFVSATYSYNLERGLSSLTRNSDPLNERGSRYIRDVAARILWEVAVSASNWQSMLLPIWFAALSHARNFSPIAECSGAIMWQVTRVATKRMSMSHMRPSMVPHDMLMIWPLRSKLATSLPIHWARSGWLTELGHQALHLPPDQRPSKGYHCFGLDELLRPPAPPASAFACLALLVREARMLSDGQCAVRNSVEAAFLCHLSSGQSLLELLDKLHVRLGNELVVSTMYVAFIVELLCMEGAAIDNCLLSSKVATEVIYKTCFQMDARHDLLELPLVWDALSTLQRLNCVVRPSAFHSTATGTDRVDHLQQLYTARAILGLTLAESLLSMEQRALLEDEAVHSLSSSLSQPSGLVHSTDWAWWSGVFCALVRSTHEQMVEGSKADSAPIFEKPHSATPPARRSTSHSFTPMNIMDTVKQVLVLVELCSVSMGAASRWCDAMLCMVVDVIPIMGRLNIAASQYLTQASSSSSLEHSTAFQIAQTTMETMKEAQVLCRKLDSAMLKALNETAPHEEGLLGAASLLSRASSVVLRTRAYVRRKSTPAVSLLCHDRCNHSRDASAASPAARDLSSLILDRLEPHEVPNGSVSDYTDDDDSEFYIQNL